MQFEYPSFGTIVIDGVFYDHDVVIEDDGVRARDKGPSKPFNGHYGHTPLSADEIIPWSKPKLVIGSGYSERLPVLSEIEATARERGIELLVMPTAEAVALLNETDQSAANAILHVTC